MRSRCLIMDSKVSYLISEPSLMMALAIFSLCRVSFCVNTSAT